jgi:hypothetical protein
VKIVLTSGSITQWGVTKNVVASLLVTARSWPAPLPRMSRTERPTIAFDAIESDECPTEFGPLTVANHSSISSIRQ